MKLCPVLAAILIWFPCSVRAQEEKVPSREEASELVKKALASVGLKHEQSTPFHLLANVEMKHGNKKSEGKYEILWSAPDKYRVNLQTTTATETDIALGDKLYISRSTPALSLEMWTANGFLQKPTSSLFLDDLAVKSVSSETVEGEKLTCVDASNALEMGLHICLDSRSDELALVRMEYIRKRKKASQIPLLELSDFVTVGNMRYPRHLAGIRQIVEIQAEVQKFEISTPFAENVFQPDPRATALDWCASPKFDPQTLPKKQEKPAHKPVWEYAEDQVVAYSIVVGPDGFAKKSYVLYSGTPSVSAHVSATLDMKYPVLGCNGRPVSYELISWVSWTN